jgi:hypothetical protein
MIERRTVTECVFSQSYCWHDEPAVDFIAALQGAVADIPPEFRDTAFVEVNSESEYDSHHAVISVSYKRPETDAEVEHRALVGRVERMNTEAQERIMLQRLKEKYGA